ncbi:hypothetical protein PaeBR_11525 [Paenibacillus sp. BR2-3]|uniref:hypothetical protein n=1 Tax=Paenibacillus sp. BR2-3 TaxID=3048494 RepID=UPI003977430B
MEDVLETYALPYDPEIPLICMDEQPIQLLEDSRPSEPMKPGQVRREDYEYVRKGSCSVFLFTEPLAGWSRTGKRKTNQSRLGTSNPGITGRSLSRCETGSARHGQFEHAHNLFVI